MRELGLLNAGSKRVYSAVLDRHSDRMSYVDRIVTVPPSSRKRPRMRVNRSILALAVIAVLVVGSLTLATMTRDAPLWRAHTATQTVIPGFTLSHQHADGPGGFPCNFCLMWMPWHIGPIMWNDTKYGGAGAPPPGDNQYGFVGLQDDCPHCIVYSGPASIQMVNGYRSGGPLVPQDMIYDDCELDTSVIPVEIQSDGICQRHGFGVLDGTGGSPSEIQTAFKMYIGPMFQHNQWDGSALAASTLASYVAGFYPVIWDDHGGWPSNMDTRWPIAPENTMQGHYKVIAGYDDQGTAIYSDDVALIYDPWPGYNDLMAVNPTPLPPGATPGPGGATTPNPYWLPVGTVLGDFNDLFLVEFAAIPEFSHLLIPIVGMTAIALVAIRTRTAREES